METSEFVNEVALGKGRKKLRIFSAKKAEERNKKYSAKELPHIPRCNHRGNKFNCQQIRPSDAYKFFRMFHKNNSKIEQDSFLMAFCKPHLPKRTDRLKGGPRKNISISYTMCSQKSGRPIKVCQKMFSSILRVSTFRIQRICKNVLTRGEAPREKRGGDRRSGKLSEHRDSVKEFIKRFPIHEIHYCRGRSGRQYLRGDLSINKMYTLYQGESITSLKVKKSFFRNVLNTFFNIGFKAPATDVCSTCTSLKERIKIEKNADVRNQLMIESTVHKKRGAAFFQMAKEEKPELLTISFDCQKNMPMPKIPDQAAYYSRQLYLFNLGVVVGSSKSKLTKQNVFLYSWTENDRPKGSNEIASAIFHRLLNLDFTGKTIVRLICDGCGGQNKNTTMVAACLYWLKKHSPSNVHQLQLIFPVAGHSFIPPDRVFGNIEKEVRLKENIITKEDYFEIFKKHGTIINLGSSECPVWNWKEESVKCLKAPGSWHFKFNQSKRFLLHKMKSGLVTVQGEVFYKSDVGAAKSVLKAGKKISDMKINALPMGVFIKDEKKRDIAKLLALHFGAEWEKSDKLLFYKGLMNENLDAEPEESQICEEQEEIKDLRI